MLLAQRFSFGYGGIISKTRNINTQNSEDGGSQRHSRVVPENNVALRLGHGFGGGVAQPVSGTSHHDDLSAHVELLHNIGRDVWERFGEVLPDLGAIFGIHRHFDVDSGLYSAL